MHYRVYLLDRQGHVRVGESFSADGDNEAATIGASVYDACNDGFSGYEVWCGTRLLAAGQTRSDAETALAVERLIARHQKNVLDLEERMQRGFACVRQSRKLLEASSRLRYPLS